MDETLLGGVVLFNAGEYRPVWTACDLIRQQEDLSSDDQTTCTALEQSATAIESAQDHRWVNTTTAAHNATTKLARIRRSHSSIIGNRLYEYLSALSDDPAVIERHRVPPWYVDKERPTVATLRFDAIGYAASAIASHADNIDTDIIADAVQYGHKETVPDSKSYNEPRGFIGTLSVFVRDPDHRGLIYRRLRSNVERRRQREQDINGLFK